MPEKLLHLPPKSCCNSILQFKEGFSWSIVVKKSHSFGERWIFLFNICHQKIATHLGYMYYSFFFFFFLEIENLIVSKLLKKVFLSNTVIIICSLKYHFTEVITTNLERMLDFFSEDTSCNISDRKVFKYFEVILCWCFTILKQTQYNICEIWWPQSWQFLERFKALWWVVYQFELEQTGFLQRKKKYCYCWEKIISVSIWACNYHLKVSGKYPGLNVTWRKLVHWQESCNREELPTTYISGSVLHLTFPCQTLC